MRFITYDPPLPAAARRYVEAVRALPGVAAWIAAALRRRSSWRRMSPMLEGVTRDW